MSINLAQEIFLSRDITEADNELLTMNVWNANILEAMKQNNPMKDQSPNGMQVSYHKAEI